MYICLQLTPDPPNVGEQDVFLEHEAGCPLIQVLLTENPGKVW